MKSGTIISLISSIALVGLLFGCLQYASYGRFADPDGFYHAKASQLLAKGNLNDQFPWTQFTTWNEHFADQHFLYHWLLSPFNSVEKLPLSVIIFGLTFVGFFWLALKFWGIRMKWFWVIIMFSGSIDFLFRVNLIKANTISLSLLCIIVILIFNYDSKTDNAQSKFFLGSEPRLSLIGILSVSSLFVWTYGGFVFIPVLLIIYAFSRLISQKSFWPASVMISLLPFLASIVGIGLGLWMHPQTNNLLRILYEQLFHSGLGAGTVVPAGNEWVRFNLWWFIKSNFLILLVWLPALVLFLRNFYSRKTLKTFELWMQLVALTLLALTLWHRRFIEYWIPFTIFATVLSYKYYFQKIAKASLISAWQHWQFKFACLITILLFIVISILNVSYVVNSLKQGESVTKYKKTSEWLKDNSKVGDTVLNTQWDQFPQLFYYDDKNYYIVGLDPTFMYFKDPHKYWAWRKIADDNPEQWSSIEQVHRIIKQDLNSKYIVVDKDRNPNFTDYILDNSYQGYFSVDYDSDNIEVISVK